MFILSVDFRNGADKSGLFCTVMAILDRVKVEQEVVIPQIIKQLRSTRPQFIPNMVLILLL